MKKVILFILFLVLISHNCFNQSIDSFQYDFIQLSESKKLDYAMEKLNLILTTQNKINSEKQDNQFTIIHFGDSHIQGDYFSGEFRNILQSYFGNSGNGIIFPYSLAKSYGPRGMLSTTNGVWSSSNILRNDNSNKGLSGYSISTFDSTAKIKISFNEKFKFPVTKKFKIWYETKTDSTDFYLNENFTVINDEKNKNGWGVRTYEFIKDSLNIELSVVQKNKKNAGFTFHGIEFISPIKSGINYYQCGVVGAKFTSLIKNAKHIFSQLEYIKPDLIIFSFGTNEAYDKNVDTTNYFDKVNAFINQLNIDVPNSAIIITTAPDTRSQGRTPPNQIAVNEQLIKISKFHDVSIFDLNKAMGGWGSLNKWYKKNLVSGDKLHFKVAGYALQGKMFSHAFLEHYNAKFKSNSLDLSILKDSIIERIKPILWKAPQQKEQKEQEQKEQKEQKEQEQKIEKEEVIIPVKIKEANSKKNSYIVKKGDSIIKIARKHNLDYKKLLRINNLTEKSIIQIGQKIKLY